MTDPEIALPDENTYEYRYHYLMNRITPVITEMRNRCMQEWLHVTVRLLAELCAKPTYENRDVALSRYTDAIKGIDLIEIEENGPLWQDAMDIFDTIWDSTPL